MNSLPWPALIAVGLGAAVLSFFGAMIGYRHAKETDAATAMWRQREESFRMMRWATEQAVQSGTAGVLGLRVLDALNDSTLLHPPEYKLLDIVQDTLIEALVDAIGGDDDVVVEVDSPGTD